MTPSAASGRVLLGVSGGIAAYKAAPLVRLLRSAGLDVRCAMTRSAASFVAPLTLEVLSGHTVYREEYLAASGGEGERSGDELHVTAAQWADVLCVAPATANTLARLALGLADDFLTTTALMFAGPLSVAPAMHDVMWRQVVVQEHMSRLRERGVLVIGPEEGPLASGEVGMGRMAEPESIVAAVVAQLRRGPWNGRSIVITAGPTFEPLDPVRFLGNRSSGKMGFCLAAEAARRGATVTLIAGPTAQVTPPRVRRIDVETALEMKAALELEAPRCDLVVMAAAVADYRPESSSRHKIKKRAGSPATALRLVQNPDLLADLASTAPSAVRVGFAAETENLLDNARAKLEAKKVHFLVANDVSRSDIGFGSDDNEAVVLRREGDPVRYSKRSKQRLAADLLDLFGQVLTSSRAAAS